MIDERLLIDKYDLDTALVENPALIHQVCDEAAEAVAHRDAMKEALDTTDAELDSEIRELTKTSKMTETAIKTTVQMHPRHKQAFDSYNQAKLKAAKAAGLEKAVEARSKAIEGLSRLYVSGYYAIDSTKRSTSANEIQYNKLREQIEARRLQK